ncbi:MAG: HIT domain-containing protein [Mycoplasmataceae bacterium]|nr:HIT domain-containing protein [Mycoplasmataceae bacterium]
MKKGNCIFCKIASKKISSMIIDENEGAIAFLDINPASDGHCVVIPKNHAINFSSSNENDLACVIKLMKRVTLLLKKKLSPKGFNYLSNEQRIAGQVIEHTHFHVIPKYSEMDGLHLKKIRNYHGNVNSVYKKIVG